MIVSAEPTEAVLDLGVDPAELRRVLSHFCSGIVVVTGMGADGPAGFTCQAFSALSLDPPLVLFTPQRTSTSWPLIQRSGRFSVNVLEAGQEPISNAFARSGTDKFADVGWRLGPYGNPVLDGVLAAIECELYETHDGGDHLIVVGRVLGMVEHPDATAPLLYFRSRYRSLV
ncbi:flavin reductase family protein [uncultured Friedmanniella sp.]|uniref:flavin reductase family protein n=1 Tax=uncultured Friedmanniella sp. TaxID=335381 RepID=UPI0035CC50F0